MFSVYKGVYKGESGKNCDKCDWLSIGNNGAPKITM